MFGGLRQLVLDDLGHGADHDEMHVGPQRGDLGQQRAVEPLVEHAVETDPRMRDRCLIGGLRQLAPRRQEMRERRPRSETRAPRGAARALPRTGCGRR